MKFECQSCLLQFDAVGSGGDNKCPRCGSNNVKPSGASASTPASNSGPVSGQAAIAATIAQPMVAPYGAPATASTGPAPFNPVGAPQAAPPNPYAPAPQSPYGAPPQAAPNPFGAPPNPYGAPQGAPPNPYGAPPNPYGAPQAAPNPYGAPASPYGAPQAAPNPYAPPQGAPMGSAFGAPMGGFGAAPMGMVPVTPFGNPQLDAEQRKATILGVLAILTIWPFAIGSFVQLNGSKQAAQMGDFNTAIAKAKSSQMWGWLAIGFTAGFIVLGCLAGLAGA
ncbi:MAG: hypothetical protein U0269_03290 [Polyangiales bacterium]